MRHTVKLPRLGDTTQSALVTEWLCAVGEEVTVGVSIVVVETDKVTTEVPTPVAGTLVEQSVPVQEEVAVGDPLCVIES